MKCVQQNTAVLSASVANCMPALSEGWQAGVDDIQTRGKLGLALGCRAAASKKSRATNATE